MKNWLRSTRLALLLDKIGFSIGQNWQFEAITIENCIQEIEGTVATLQSSLPTN
jgi:hypothetical protein